jgi:porin
MVYRVPGTTDQGIAIFARVSGAPSDRNLIDFYVDGGATWKGLIPNRGDDTLGVSFAYAKISDRVRAFDVDTIAFTGMAQPARSSEAVIEATYQAQIVPGWTVQPDLQYIIRPGAGVLNGRYPSEGIQKNAFVVGLRTTVRY